MSTSSVVANLPVGVSPVFLVIPDTHFPLSSTFSFASSRDEFSFFENCCMAKASAVFAQFRSCCEHWQRGGYISVLLYSFSRRRVGSIKWLTLRRTNCYVFPHLSQRIYTVLVHLITIFGDCFPPIMMKASIIVTQSTKLSSMATSMFLGDLKRSWWHTVARVEDISFLHSSLPTQPNFPMIPCHSLYPWLESLSACCSITLSLAVQCNK